MKRAGILVNSIMVIMIIILMCTLLYTLFSYRKEERKKTESLRREADQKRQEEKDESDPVPESLEEPGDETQPEEETEAKLPEDQEEASPDNQKNEEQPATKEAAASTIRISCRGESWNVDDAARGKGGWPYMLGDLIKKADKDVEITDATWDMAGTLSQMMLAGVPEKTVNAYIDAHIKNGLQDDMYETVVRDDLQDRYVQRGDQKAIPVICVGYRGGYGRTMNELFEQQKLILGTYKLQEAGTDRQYNDGKFGISGKYVIIGRLPATWEDPDHYDNRMKTTWGDHYISLNDIDGDILSEDFRKSVAQIVYTGMQDLGYLE